MIQYADAAKKKETPGNYSSRLTRFLAGVSILKSSTSLSRSRLIELVVAEPLGAEREEDAAVLLLLLGAGVTGALDEWEPEAAE